jgi:hypothetical protein
MTCTLLLKALPLVEVNLEHELSLQLAATIGFEGFSHGWCFAYACMDDYGFRLAVVTEPPTNKKGKKQIKEREIKTRKKEQPIRMVQVVMDLTYLEGVRFESQPRHPESGCSYFSSVTLI